MMIIKEKKIRNVVLRLEKYLDKYYKISIVGKTVSLEYFLLDWKNANKLFRWSKKKLFDVDPDESFFD